MRTEGSSSSTIRRAGFWVALSAAGLVVRLLIIPVSPQYGYPYDHDDMVRWGIQAADKGVLTLYDHPPPRWDLRVWQGGQWVITQRALDRLCVYPPLTAYLIAVSGGMFEGLSADRLINTVLSRTVFGLWSLLADFLLAWGCASLVAIFKPGRAVRWAYALVLLAPPFWLDTCLWGQTDTVLLAAAVWMVRALVLRRWIVAGVLFGVTAALKPQAVLWLPVWALAIATLKPRTRPLLGLAWSAATLLILALPFVVHGGWTWFQVSYVTNLLAEFPKTTLKAFNLWYLDLLICDSTDVSVRWWGITKDGWGRLFTLLALSGGFGWLAWRRRSDPRALVTWSGLSLLFCVMLPTRVHERYLLVALPFIIVLSTCWARFLPGLAALLLVATLQMSWPLWLHHPAGQWEGRARTVTRRYAPDRRAARDQRQTAATRLAERLEAERRAYLRDRRRTLAVEWGATALALAGAGAVVGAALSLKPGRAETSEPRG